MTESHFSLKWTTIRTVVLIINYLNISAIRISSPKEIRAGWRGWKERALCKCRRFIHTNTHPSTAKNNDYSVHFLLSNVLIFDKRYFPGESSNVLASRWRKFQNNLLITRSKRKTCNTLHSLKKEIVSTFINTLHTKVYKDALRINLNPFPTCGQACETHLWNKYLSLLYPLLDPPSTAIPDITMW